ncbi:SPW repeat domain-containing protein [Paenibacillus radicis (ex Xue et al. 2023)]|uniref:SPW repeat protein n=1 Tax=Paenibacillus radicis (ex Xue et al. 2023) TaxID=2972489 RepID=A0ABT1YCE0_9BACL|nr:SPW repeat protein [Paenibacillus radicis (ex Xue et al. 2023)]MCR8630831.1 SPW repeat protein [Paenibacillus radicis (ex Xue et al. 2023)]
MIVKNVLSSFIGVWFIFTPWIFGFTGNSTEYYTCLTFGSIQFIFSLLASMKPWKFSVMNWAPLLTGVWFIIFPNAFDMYIVDIVVLEILGLATILLNYALIFPESQ